MQGWLYGALLDSKDTRAYQSQTNGTILLVENLIYWILERYAFTFHLRLLLYYKVDDDTCERDHEET